MDFSFSWELVLISEDFVSLVRSLVPDRESLVRFGLDDDEIVEIQGSFRCEPRCVDRSNTTSVCELEKLTNEYDCSSLEISLLSFAGPAKNHPFGKMIGWREADPIVVVPD